MPAAGQQTPSCCTSLAPASWLPPCSLPCALLPLPTAPTHPPTSPKQVTAFEGPSSQSDPMVVDSSTPGADGAPASSTSASASGSGPSTTPGSEDGSSANGGCREVPTPDGYSCQQQKDWGKCGQDFIQTNGYCKCTCGGGGSGGGSNNDNGGQQQQQQAGGNRRMLRQRR